MNCQVVETQDALSFYIDGYLQFDSRDEAIYHESLALPALSLLRQRGIEEPRILIFGGGDGLALRECLRFPGVRHVDLVDISAEVLDLGKTQFASLNAHSFDDKRVTTRLADAWEWQPEQRYDLIICDFTFPRTNDDARLLSVEWFKRLGNLLTPNGIAAINSVSPEKTKPAFWCIVNTSKRAGMRSLPYRVCVPSFREHGYGVWAFILMSKEALHVADLQQLECPVETRMADLGRLWRGARFSRAERLQARSIPAHSIERPVLIDLIKGSPKPKAEVGYPSLDALTDAIPVVHEFHTREMIKTLAEQVIGSIRSVDLRRLVEEICARAKALPERLRLELERLRDFLRTNFSLRAGWNEWSARLFATLVIVLTIANTLAPDNAFAKGHAGLGHASMSRGSFGRGGEFGHSVAAEPGAVSGPGFRTGGFGSSGPVDIYGYRYTPRIYYYTDYGPGYGYYGGGYYGGGSGGGSGSGPNNGAPPSQRGKEHQPVFVADDDMMVMDNGDVVVTLSDDAFLLVKNGTVNLISQKSGPLMPLYADPNMFDRINVSLQSQVATAKVERQSREEWLSWTGWTSALFSAVQQDKNEVHNLTLLEGKLNGALTGLGRSPEAGSIKPQPQEVELFTGCYVLPNGTIEFHGPGNKTTSYASGSLGATTEQMPEPLKKAVIGILKKLGKESQGDIASAEHDLLQINSDEAATQKDLQEYKNIYATYNDPYYEVDYGTDEIPVRTAIDRTYTDLGQIRSDKSQTEAARDKAQNDLNTIRLSLQGLGEQLLP